MNPGVPVALLQLRRNPRRLLIAVAGLVMSSFGILCQMGFEDSLFRSATRLFTELDADLVVISPQYQFMVLPAQFSERRLQQALGATGVNAVASLRLGVAPFKNPITGINRTAYIVGAPRTGRVFIDPDWQAQLRRLSRPDAVLFDARSRPEFGPVGQLHRRGPVVTEIAREEVQVAGLFEMGASFSADGTVIVSDEGFLRIFPHRHPGLIDVGLITLEAGHDAATVLDDVRRQVPDDVLVLTHAEFNAREQAYWRSTTPAGFIFNTIFIVSLLVGVVSAYQILYSDVMAHLSQYATLKAIGYPDRYFRRLTFEKAWLLSSMAFPVGFLLAEAVYVGATRLTLVPLVMTPGRVVGVYVITLAAASAAGLVAIRRLRRLDPTDLL
ncbi:MAG TPA: ABC transporter permease DevC [Luteitalea sp.]|nr:ABC transporter permease DevC [Luteitalea sp.]